MDTDVWIQSFLASWNNLFLVVSQPLARNKCFTFFVCALRTNSTLCPSLSKVFNPLSTPTRPPPPASQLNLFPSIVKRKFHECRSWDTWIFVSPQGAYLRWALWVECKEPSKGISIALEQISSYQMAGLIGWLSIFLRKPSEGLRQLTGCGLLTLAFIFSMFIFLLSAAARAGFNFTKLKGWEVSLFCCPPGNP